MMGWTVKFDHMSSDGRYVVRVYVDHSGGMEMDTPMTTPMTMTQAWYYVSPLTGSVEYKLEY